jgi:hypothetical protein
MNHDDIIRMAREAGIPIEIDWAGRPSTLVIKDGGTYLRGIDDLERFAELVAAKEREECAQVCDDIEDRKREIIANRDALGDIGPRDCALSIRARGRQ